MEDLFDEEDWVFVTYILFVPFLLSPSLSEPYIRLTVSSWFYWGWSSTYLTLYFTVRARALASLLSAITGVIATTILGFFLDSPSFTIHQRARYGAVFTFTLFSGILVWAMVVEHSYHQVNPGKLDWTSDGFGRGFGVNIMINTAGNLVQNYLVRPPSFLFFFLFQMKTFSCAMYIVLVGGITRRRNIRTHPSYRLITRNRSVWTVCEFWYECFVRPSAFCSPFLVSHSGRTGNLIRCIQ